MMVGLVNALKFRKAFGVWPRSNVGKRVETVLREAYARKAALEKLKKIAESAGFSATVQKVRTETMQRMDHASIPKNHG